MPAAMHMIAGAGLGTVSYASPVDGSDGVWGLRESPFPRSTLGLATHQRQDYSVGPYPNLPWKGDWTTNQGRAKGLVGLPLFERPATNYSWKDCPYDAHIGRGVSNESAGSVDLLFGYWLGRAYGVIGPNE